MHGLLVVMAHPDDESMGTGGLILRHSRADVEVNLICATRGEKGWGGKPPGARREDLSRITRYSAGLAAPGAAATSASVQRPIAMWSGWPYAPSGPQPTTAAGASLAICSPILVGVSIRARSWVGSLSS
jgi:hypothetical protein